MVYLQQRSGDSTCKGFVNLRPDLAAIKTCQDEAKTPYCWPPNGTRICILATNVALYWPPSYYDEDSYLWVNYNQRSTPNKSIQYPSGEPLNTGLVTFMMADKIPGRPNEKAVNITIHEQRSVSDSPRLVVHQGPTLILVVPDGLMTARASATASPAPPHSDGPKLPPGTIAGICLGALVGAFLLGMLCFSCCGCGCCGKMGEAERKRVRRQQALREQREMDEAKLEGVVTAPTRAATRPASIGSDEIRVVEEQRVPRTVGADASEPPPYEAPPPKYTP